MSADEQTQREDILEQKNKAEDLLRVLFSIVDKVKSEADMSYHALALINGIIEDKRSRIRFLVSIQRTANKANHMDLVGILNSYLIQNPESEKQNQRDLAAHVLAMLIENVEYKNCAVAARNFLTYLFDVRSQNKLSIIAYTHCMMFLLKTNDLALEFVNKRGFEMYKELL